jgi:ATP-dependent DNA helicase RecQ
MLHLNDSLKTHFGFSDFRPGQTEALQSLISGRHTLAVMPTGAGKSLIYQLAALVLRNESKNMAVTLVVSPLIALMKDQVDSLNQRGIPVTFINSSLSSREQAERMQGISERKYRLVYVAPERLRNTKFLEIVQKIPINLMAVDEAHCISEWGHDFRPDYMNIRQVRLALGSPLTVALTATATPAVQSDIIHNLGLPEDAARIVTGFNRPNLFLNVRYANGPDNKLRALADLTSQPQKGAVIIYTGTRRDAEEVADFVRDVLQRPAQCYHAGMALEERTRIQDDFISGWLDLIAATNAFGMGIITRKPGALAGTGVQPGLP